MTIRISDKRQIPVGFLVNGEFLLMDEGPEHVDRWEQVDSLDYQLTIFNLTGERYAILPENEGHRKTLREHFLDACRVANLISKSKAPAMNQNLYNETPQACLAGGMTDDAAHEYATDKATRNEAPKPQHTPGPWVALERYTNRQAVPIGRQRDSMCHDIFAEAHGPNCEANAVLIAKAPEMFNLLRNAADCLEIRFQTDYPNESERTLLASIRQVVGGEL